MTSSRTDWLGAESHRRGEKSEGIESQDSIYLSLYNTRLYNEMIRHKNELLFMAERAEASHRLRKEAAL